MEIHKCFPQISKIFFADALMLTQMEKKCLQLNSQNGEEFKSIILDYIFR